MGGGIYGREGFVGKSVLNLSLVRHSNNNGDNGDDGRDALASVG